MPREPEPSVNERTFVLEALQQGLRLDDRRIDEYRTPTISFSPDHGIADVQMGNTRVLTEISATVTQPPPDRKFDGLFTITAELSPLASPAFETGRSSDLEAHLTSTLDTLLRRSNALSTESLCLVAGQRVWHVRATLHVLSAAGSLLTCASLSLLAALAHYRIPATEVHGGELTVFGLKERDPVPLALLHHPVCISLAFYSAAGNAAEGAGGGSAGGGLGEMRSLVDPTLVEEQVGSGELVVGANKEGEVVLVEKNGGAEVEGLELVKCIGNAVKKAKELVRLVDGALEEDAKKRDKGGLLSRELRSENVR